MKSRGFTLIEVLVALVVVAVLSLLAWRVIDGMSRANEQTVQHEKTLARVQAMLGQWSADWDALSTGLDAPALDFDGAGLRLVRRSTQDSAGVVVVAWALHTGAQGRQLERWVAPAVTTRAALQESWDAAARWVRTPLAEDAKRTTRFMGISDWQLQYFRGNAWTNPLSAADSPGKVGAAVSAIAQGAVAVPDGVRLVLQLRDEQNPALSGSVTRLWVAPWQGATP